METKINLLILIEQSLLPKNVNEIHKDLDMWLNEMYYCHYESKLSIQDYFIIKNLLKATVTSQTYKNYYLVHYDKLVETSMDQVEYNNETLGINDLKARYFDQMADELKTSVRPKIRSTKPMKYQRLYMRKHIERLKKNNFLNFDVSEVIIDGVKNVAAQTNIGFFNKVAILTHPVVSKKPMLKKSVAKISPVNLDQPGLSIRDQTDAYFDVFDKNFAPDEKTAVSKEYEVIDNVYQVKIDDRIFHIRKTSQRLAGNKDHYAAQCLARDRKLLSDIQNYFFDIDVQRICSKDWEYTKWQNEYSISRIYLLKIMGYTSSGTNAYNVVHEAITRLTTVLHTLSVDKADIYAMQILGYVDEYGNGKQEVRFNYLDDRGKTYDVNDNPNTDMFNPSAIDQGQNNSIYYLGWNKFDEALYRKKLKFLDERKLNMIKEWELRGNINEPKPELEESFVRSFLEGFQISRYQNKSIAQIPNKHLDVAQSLISALVNEIRGAGFWLGVHQTKEMTSAHKLNSTKYLNSFVEEKIKIDNFEGDYITSMVLPTLCEPCFYLGSKGLHITLRTMKVSTLYTLLNDVIFVKIHALNDSDRPSSIKYTIDAIVVTREFATTNLVPFLSNIQQIVEVSKRENRNDLKTIAANENNIDIDKLGSLFVLAFSESQKWRNEGENVHGAYHPSQHALNEATKYIGEKPVEHQEGRPTTQVQNITEFENKLAVKLFFQTDGFDPSRFEAWYETSSNHSLNELLVKISEQRPQALSVEEKNYKFTGRTVIEAEYTKND